MVYFKKLILSSIASLALLSAAHAGTEDDPYKVTAKKAKMEESEKKEINFIIKCLSSKDVQENLYFLVESVKSIPQFDKKFESFIEGNKNLKTLNLEFPADFQYTPTTQGNLNKAFFMNTSLTELCICEGALFPQIIKALKYNTSIASLELTLNNAVREDFYALLDKRGNDFKALTITFDDKDSLDESAMNQFLERFEKANKLETISFSDFPLFIKPPPAHEENNQHSSSEVADRFLEALLAKKGTLSEVFLYPAFVDKDYEYVRKMRKNFKKECEKAGIELRVEW